MSLHYWVAYRTPAGFMAGAEVAVDHDLDGERGRYEARQALAEQGVDRPQITGWALRQATDQEK